MSSTSLIPLAAVRCFVFADGTGCSPKSFRERLRHRLQYCRWTDDQSECVHSRHLRLQSCAHFLQPIHEHLLRNAVSCLSISQTIHHSHGTFMGRRRTCIRDSAPESCGNDIISVCVSCGLFGRCELETDRMLAFAVHHWIKKTGSHQRKRAVWKPRIVPV